MLGKILKLEHNSSIISAVLNAMRVSPHMGQIMNKRPCKYHLDCGVCYVMCYYVLSIAC